MLWSSRNIPNPWAHVTVSNVFADGDYSYPVNVGKGGVKKSMPFGTKAYEGAINSPFPKAKLTFDSLPEPYSGSPDANVYCLNMNPGAPDINFDDLSLGHTKYTQEVIKNLNHKVTSAFWRDNLVMDTGKSITLDSAKFDSIINGKTISGFSIHEGAKWQRKITKGLKGILGRNPNLFFLEYFPYHSASGFDFPEYLPSYYYRNSLLEFAMDDDKLIVIMRQENKWYNIKDRNIGNRLKAYKKKIILKNKQGAWLTRDNMLLPIPNSRCDSLSWYDIIGHF